MKQVPLDLFTSHIKELRAQNKLHINTDTPGTSIFISEGTVVGKIKYSTSSDTEDEFYIYTEE